MVDDDEALVRLIRLSLSIEGLEVITATDGIVALEKIDADGFDVLVLDLQMPRMDGRELFRRLRDRGYNVPVLILSAYGAEAARLELRAEAAMGKPFNTEELVSRVRSLIDPA